MHQSSLVHAMTQYQRIVLIISSIVCIFFGNFFFIQHAHAQVEPANVIVERGLPEVLKGTKLVLEAVTERTHTQGSVLASASTANDPQIQVLMQLLEQLIAIYTKLLAEQQGNQSASKGIYKLYVTPLVGSAEGDPYYDDFSITRQDALTHCKLYEYPNRKHIVGTKIRCTWNGTEIFKSTDTSTSGISVIVTSPNTGNEIGILNSREDFKVSWRASGVPHNAIVCVILRKENVSVDGFALGQCHTAKNGNDSVFEPLRRNNGYNLEPGNYRAWVQITESIDDGRVGIIAEDYSDEPFRIIESNQTPTQDSSSCAGTVIPVKATSKVVTASAYGGPVWGSGPYFTADSNLSTIARYLGAPEGGSATLSVSGVGCEPSFAGGTRNGVTTSSYNTYQGKSVVCTSGCSSTPQAPLPTLPTVTVPPPTTTTSCPGTSVTSGTQTVTANASGGSVWGSGPFTSDSSLSAIARFLGAPQGGVATLSITGLGCSSTYEGSTKNNVTTYSYGSYRGKNVTCTSGCSSTPQAPLPTLPTVTVPPPTTTTSCPGIDITSGTQTVTANASGGSVWGNGPFTADSNLSAIARYLGAPQGGSATLSVTNLGCQSSYTGGSQNTVTTLSYGSYKGKSVTCISGCSGSSQTATAIPSAPPAFTASCVANGTSLVTTSFATPGATYYHLRVDSQRSSFAPDFNDNCSSVNVGDTCNNNYTATSYTGSATLNNYYDLWVHACNAYGCSPAATHSNYFKCLAN